MALSFSGVLDRAAVVRASDQLVDLVAADATAAAWERESALPGMTVGGLARHLVSQPECAAEFLAIELPAQTETVPLVEYYERVDWLDAGIEEEANTSIRDGFNALGAQGLDASLAVLDRSRTDLVAAIIAAGPATYVPWQGCALDTDDFLVCRLMEIVVHADDLATSVGLPTLPFDDDVYGPVLGLLAALSARRHGAQAVLRSLARTERAGGSISAF
ncbi:MAG TPA: maleylpyruvate isomerase N-terminal domain-containing protein [Nocardioidaceae bacterium]